MKIKRSSEFKDQNNINHLWRYGGFVTNKWHHCLVRVDKDEDGRVTEEEVAEVRNLHTIQLLSFSHILFISSFFFFLNEKKNYIFIHILSWLLYFFLIFLVDYFFLIFYIYSWSIVLTILSTRKSHWLYLMTFTSNISNIVTACEHDNNSYR